LAGAGAASMSARRARSIIAADVAALMLAVDGFAA
jgi:hypothetical protein